MKITAEDMEKAVAIQQEEHRVLRKGECASCKEATDIFRNCPNLKTQIVDEVMVASIAGDSRLDLWGGGFLMGVTLTLKAIALAEQRSKEVSDLERMIQSTD